MRSRRTALPLTRGRDHLARRACRAFDARSRGRSFGSGTGCVVLKRIAEALAEARGARRPPRLCELNNDDSRKVGYIAASVGGQARVVAEALAMAGVGAESISYVETHGTGTLRRSERGDSPHAGVPRSTSNKQYCAISV